MPTDSEILDTMIRTLASSEQEIATLRKYAAIARLLETDWALVPQKVAISPEGFASLEYMCGGPDHEAIGGEGGEDRWLDGILWVGETIGDNGEKYYGLNIACADVLEEGSIPVSEFAAPQFQEEGK